MSLFEVVCMFGVGCFVMFWCVVVLLVCLVIVVGVSFVLFEMLNDIGVLEFFGV